MRADFPYFLEVLIMNRYTVFKFLPSHITLMRHLSWEGEDGYPYRRRYFLVKSVAADGKIYFSLEFLDVSPREYVRRVTRIIPLKDYEAKILLISCFFYESEYALSVGSSWSLRTQAGSVLRVLENLFPDCKVVHDDYFSDTQSEIEAKVDRRQRLMIDRIEYERAVRCAVFPRLSLPPKSFHS